MQEHLIGDDDGGDQIWTARAGMFGRVEQRQENVARMIPPARQREVDVVLLRLARGGRIHEGGHVCVRAHSRAEHAGAVAAMQLARHVPGAPGRFRMEPGHQRGEGVDDMKRAAIDISRAEILEIQVLCQRHQRVLDVVARLHPWGRSHRRPQSDLPGLTGTSPVVRPLTSTPPASASMYWMIRMVSRSIPWSIAWRKTSSARVAIQTGTPSSSDSPM